MEEHSLTFLKDSKVNVVVECFLNTYEAEAKGQVLRLLSSILLS